VSMARSLQEALRALEERSCDCEPDGACQECDAA
jgi:hypothetical protein